jgi:hypothetical protein
MSDALFYTGGGTAPRPREPLAASDDAARA